MEVRDDHPRQFSERQAKVAGAFAHLSMCWLMLHRRITN